MAEPYPHEEVITGRLPIDAPTNPAAHEPPRSDADLTHREQADTPKGRRAPLPPDDPSKGMIDEGGIAR